MKWYIGIVLYNPDIKRLKENISALLATKGWEKIILVDNGSQNSVALQQLWKQGTKFEWIINTENKGVATALNQMLLYTSVAGGERCLTLDQDSIISEKMVNKYLEYINKNAGILTCNIEDRNFGTMHYSALQESFSYVDFCITSGSFLSVKAWTSIGRFNESLFIDGVDFDFCIRLRSAGYEILRINDVFLSHEVGHAKKVHLFGRTALVLNHPPLRLYYIARNYLYLGFIHHQKCHWIMEVLKRWLLVMLYEKRKLKKTLFILKGIYHFSIGKMGKYQ